jgi:ferrochelatase
MNSKTAVLLLQMGAPENLGAIRPFLYNLFSDPSIVPLPGPPPLRKGLARLISFARSRKVADRYRAIGGGSPLVAITRRQAEGLEKWLAGRGRSVPVRAVMGYCPPRAGEVLAGLRKEGVESIVALTLYPQYSRTTTGSSLEDLRAALARERGLGLRVVDRWGDDPGYVGLLCRWVAGETAKLRPEVGDNFRVLFSAHGLPERLVREGDPYLEEVKRTVAAVASGTGLTCRLSFQSRLGPVRWLEPSTGAVMRELAAEGVKGLLVVPVSFVSDHIETLWDMDIVYRELAAGLGFAAYRRLPAFNDHPAFIEILGRLAETSLG